MEALYSKVLGAQWKELHPSVQQMHSFNGRVITATGRFDIRRGRNWIARWVAWLLRMPAANDTASVSLRITQDDVGEAWQRTIEGNTYPSRQRIHAPGILSERLSILEFRFHLKAERGCLIYAQRAFLICLFGMAVPWPHWLSPRISASECPVPGTSECRIEVEIRFPFLGTLLQYGGVLQRVPS